MSDVQHQQFTLAAADDHRIPVQTWSPVGTPAVIIQVFHGLGEYSDRYARFASAAVARGYAVCAHDHRGHGPHTSHLGHLADRNGWQSIVADARLVNEHLRDTSADTPIVLLGHSMGSYVAQSYAMHYGGELKGLILSASTWSSRLQLYVAYTVAEIEAWRVGARVNSPLLDKIGFGNFNKPFEPARTGLDWLSRDAAEVDKYVADPLCGGPYSVRLWLDVIGGLLEISSDNALTRIPASLPVLITGGEVDPVGGDKKLTKLLQHYAQTGHQRLKYKVYPDGRHEMLNETNRDAVTADWLDWVVSVT